MMVFSNNKLKSKNKGVVALAIFITSIFFAITLFGIHQSKNLADKTKAFYNSPFVVTNSLLEIRGFIFELKEKLEILQKENTKNNLLVVEEHLSKNEEKTKFLIEKIETRYLGPKEDIQDLKQSKDQISLFYQEFQNDSNQEIYLSKNLESLFSIIEEYTNRIAKVESFAFNKAEELSLEAEELKNQTQFRLIIALIMGLLLIVLSSVLVIRNNIKNEKKIFKSRRDLEKSERLFRSLFENAPLGISMTGLDGSLKINKSFCHLIGYSEAELITKNWKEISHKDDISVSEEIVSNLLKGDTDDAIFEKRYIHKNGNIIWTNVATHLLRDEANKPLFFITFVLDISSEKKQKIELIKLNKSLLDSNKELEEFAYVASHDLQEPLRTISSFTQLLDNKLNNQLNDDLKKYMFFITDGAKRLQQMINDLLQYSRVNSVDQTFVESDLNEILNKALNKIQSKIEQKNAKIETSPLPAVKVIPSLIEILLKNLVDNGIKYNESKIPTIKVSFIEQKNYFEFSIEDNGIGIKHEFKDKIFTIFKRLHAKNEYSGTGIGLALCYRIIKKHNGAIWVEPSPAGGSIFKFKLPKD